jgi:hypothetical protein
MNIIYRITYLPHLKNQTPPYYYIGSKYNYNKNYWGSPSSKQKDWYSDNMSIKEWWKIKIKNNINDFSFEILEEYNNMNASELVLEEKKIQLQFNVKNNDEYFNKSIATSGWVSVPRTKDSKEKISNITKKYWSDNSDKAKQRRELLSQRNKQTKSQQMKEKWKNPSEKMIKGFEKFIEKSKSKEKPWLKCSRNKKSKKIYADGVIYENAHKASLDIGIHPVNIRRRCRDKNFSNWYYCED